MNDDYKPKPPPAPAERRLFIVGDHVQPKPEHPIDHRGVAVPSGMITATQDFGAGQLVQVEGSPWFLAGYFDPGEPSEPRQEPQSSSPPSLQDLVEAAGRRKAARLGEEYDPFSPRHAGYPELTDEELAAHRHAVDEWKQSRGIGIRKHRPRD